MAGKYCPRPEAFVSYHRLGKPLEQENLLSFGVLCKCWQERCDMHGKRTSARPKRMQSPMWLCPRPQDASVPASPCT
eukprot:5943021-Amphidinium_carterae.1